MNISIILPVRNQPMFVDWCIRSVIQNTDMEYELIVIDDDSNIETKEMLKKHGSNIKLLTNTEQKWLSYNWNLGIEHSRYDYICFLNSDTIVGMDWARYLLEPFNLQEKIGVVGPTTSCCWGKQQHDKYHSRRYSLKTLAEINQVSLEVSREFLNDKYEFIDVVGFCFIACSRIFSEDKILFDEQFKGPGNEADWGVRIREKGYKSVWSKMAYVHHFGRISFNGELGHEEAWKLWHEGDFLLEKKYGKKVTLSQ